MTLEEMRARVFEKRPVFAKIIQHAGSEPLVAYLQASIPIQPKKDQKRSTEFLAHFKRFLSAWVPSSAIPDIIDSITRTWTVGTADHHGIPWHPFFANENLAHARALRVRDVSYAVTFASSGVSLGNSSLPRSIGYHTDQGTLKRAHFFPASDRMRTVYGMPPVSPDVLRRFTHERRLQPIADLWLRDTYVQEARSFSHQVTQMTRVLTDRLPTEFFARIAYLPLEEFVTDILLHEPEASPLWELITTHASQYVDATKNIQGAHAEDFSHGSMIFWKQRSNGLRQSIRHKPTESLHELRELLERGELYPTYALCLMILSCYYGVTCMGGFSQVEYLLQIHEAYAQLANSCHLPPLQSNHPSVFCGACVIAREGGAPATLIDVILREEYSSLVSTLEREPLQKSIEGIIPDIYAVLH